MVSIVGQKSKLRLQL